jgi:hypothetical protein
MRILRAERLAAAAEAARDAAADAAAALDVVDVVEVAPAGRWRLEDVDRLTRPARLAGDAAVTVAVGLDDGSAAVWDRLLRVVEEPPTPWWLFVAVRSDAGLPAPLRARALDVSDVVAADPAAELTAAGWDVDAATRLVAVVGVDIHLVDALGPDEAVVVAVERLAAAAAARDPAATLAAIETLVAKDTAKRQAFLRWVIASARDSAARSARGAALDADPSEHRAAVARMTAADRAAAALSRQANPSVVLWVLWQDC